MLREKHRLLWLVLVFALATAPLAAAGAADGGPEAPAPSAPAGGIVGNGDPNTCDETALHDALAGGGDVVFNCGGGPKTIVIISPQTITTATTIDGGGLITITGGLATRLFDVADGVPFTLRAIGLTAANSGASDGGAISNGGRLTLDHVTIQNSQTDENHSGGALFTTGPVTITASSLHHNSGGNAGAIFAYGAGAVLRLSDTRVTSNHATNGAVIGGGKGGGLWVGPAADVTLVNSIWTLNTAEGNGGAIYNEGQLSLYETIVSNSQTTLDVNATGRGYGGGIATIGPLSVSHSYIYTNKARYGGGVFVGESGSSLLAQFDETSFQLNQAVYSGGGLYTSSDNSTVMIDSTLFASNVAASGGAIGRSNSGLSIIRTSIGANTATTGGGISSSAGPGLRSFVQVIDSTIYSNVVTTTLGSGGGAILNDALMNLKNVTLKGNTSGVYNGGGGAVMDLGNSVLYNLGPNCEGTLPATQGGNFASDTTCGLGGTQDAQGNALNPQLGPLMSNEHDTVIFFLPLPGSPLINTAVAPCSALDQRGATRLDACDKGAVEFGGILPELWLPLIQRTP